MLPETVQIQVMVLLLQLLRIWAILCSCISVIKAQNIGFYENSSSLLTLSYPSAESLSSLKEVFISTSSLTSTLQQVSLQLEGGNNCLLALPTEGSLRSGVTHLSSHAVLNQSITLQGEIRAVNRAINFITYDSSYCPVTLQLSGNERAFNGSSISYSLLLLRDTTDPGVRLYPHQKRLNASSNLVVPLPVTLTYPSIDIADREMNAVVFASVGELALPLSGKLRQVPKTRIFEVSIESALFNTEENYRLSIGVPWRFETQQIDIFFAPLTSQADFDVSFNALEVNSTGSFSIFSTSPSDVLLDLSDVLQSFANVGSVSVEMAPPLDPSASLSILVIFRSNAGIVPLLQIQCLDGSANSTVTRLTSGSLTAQVIDVVLNSNNISLSAGQFVLSTPRSQWETGSASSQDWMQSAPITFNATAADLTAALQSLSSLVGLVNVTNVFFFFKLSSYFIYL